MAAECWCGADALGSSVECDESDVAEIDLILVIFGVVNGLKCRCALNELR